MSSEAAAAAGVVAILFILFYIFIILLWCVFFFGGIALWIWMLIDCIQRDFKKSDDKILWVLVIALVQVLGAVIYYFVIKKPNKK
ncbi:MAG: hypothetical protein GY861_23705 [bacterium]|nr:hypothetical protein [bacterium]